MDESEMLSLSDDEGDERFEIAVAQFDTLKIAESTTTNSSEYSLSCNVEQKYNNLNNLDGKYLVSEQDRKIIDILELKGYSQAAKICTNLQGSVWRAISPQHFGHKSVVIKIASKMHYKSSQKEHDNILQEIDLLKKINGAQQQCSCDVVKDCIINCLDTIDDKDNYYVVLEDGGCDLLEFIEECHREIQRNKMCIKDWQKTVRQIGYKLSRLIVWLHEKMNLCHLDFSLENVLISNVEWIHFDDQNKCNKMKLKNTFKLKLCDFGAAKVFDDDFRCDVKIGKSSYCSPQIYNLQTKDNIIKSYDARAADCWSFGVCLFSMAIGCPPWRVPSETDDLFRTIVLDKSMDHVLQHWNKTAFLDETLRDLLSRIFVMDENLRISAQEMIEHSFFAFSLSHSL